jgi:hypothetical protein
LNAFPQRGREEKNSLAIGVAEVTQIQSQPPILAQRPDHRMGGLYRCACV